MPSSACKKKGITPESTLADTLLPDPAHCPSDLNADPLIQPVDHCGAFNQRHHPGLFQTLAPAQGCRVTLEMPPSRFGIVIHAIAAAAVRAAALGIGAGIEPEYRGDRKSTRLNSSH